MKNKKIVWGILLSYLAQGVQIIIALCYTPFMLRTLGKNEYGLYQLVGSVVSYLSLLSLGFGSAYTRFYFKKKVSGGEKEVSELNGMFICIFSVLSFICLICGGFLTYNITSVFGKGLSVEEYSIARILMVLMILNMAITFPMSVFNSYITAQEEFVIQKLIVLIGELCNPFLCVPLLLMGHGSVVMASVALFINIVKFILVWSVSIKKLGMRFSFHNFRFSELKEMWVFTFFLFLNQIIDQINWNVDKFLLGRYTGTGEVAVYGVASQVNALYMALSTSISNVFAPRVNKIVAETDNNNKLTDIFVKVGRMQFMLLLLVLLVFSFFGEKFICLWAGNDYIDAYKIGLLLIFAITVPLIENVGIEIQRAKNKHKARSIVYFFIAIANIFISIPLIMKFSAIGAAMGTFITMLIGNTLFMNWYYQKRIGINVFKLFYEFIRFIPVIIGCITLGVSMRLLVDFSNIILYGVCGISYVVVYVILLYTFVLKKEEKNIVYNMKSKFVKKLRRTN